jgi:Mg2+ and Co2+ transporter CorA
VKVTWYLLDSGKLIQGPAPAGWQAGNLDPLTEIWLDIESPQPRELRTLLAPLALHPLVLARCLVSKNVPGAVSSETTVLLEFPAVIVAEADDPTYLTLLLQSGILVTLRPAPMPALDDLVQELLRDKETEIAHLAQLMYLMLDHLADLSVRAEIEVRDQVLRTARTLTEDPGKVDGAELTRLRWQVDRLASLTENQLYSVAGLKASDNPALKEPHRNAYVQDLVSELELAQRGTYRLDSRVNDLYSYYQMIQSDQVDRRLRILTIVSVIALPLGLIAGLLGMNVGGVPATHISWGLAIVMALMVLIALIELLYFKRRGWFR